jgi:hypothetical protein
MVGFSLAHSAAIIPLMLSVLAAGLWLGIAIIWLCVAASRGRRPSRGELCQCFATAAPFVILQFIPATT